MFYEAQLKQALEEKKQQHLFRHRRVLAGPQGAEVLVDGQSLVNFCSNDYLGLANNRDVIKRFQSAANQYGVGSGASHLVIGHSAVHHELEERLADWVGASRVLLFSSGYMANLGAINSLVGRGDFVYQDRLNHASLLDAGLLSGAKFQRFFHNDVGNLLKRLSKQQSQADDHRHLVVVDGVFSMDGDVAPLNELVGAVNQHPALLMVDDAHGLGVLGEGRGSLVEYGLSEQQVPIYMGTLGKALGTSGAFVAGSELLIETLIQSARTYIFTTAMPPAVAAATLESLAVIEREPQRVVKLHRLIKRFRDGASQLGLPLMTSRTAIQPIMVDDSPRALLLSQSLMQQGFLVGAIRPPTVPAGTARLRVTLSAANDEAQVDRLLHALQVAVREFPAQP